MARRKTKRANEVQRGDTLADGAVDSVRKVRGEVHVLLAGGQSGVAYPAEARVRLISEAGS